MKNRFRLLSAALILVLAISGLCLPGMAQEVRASSDVRAAWISYIDMGEAGLKDISEASFRAKVGAIYDQAAAKGLNTVYVHARAFSDAIYPSPNFPWAEWITSSKSGPGYDPLGIMVELAHRKGLRIEAWMNPYRISTSSTRTSYVKSTSTADQLSRMIEYKSSSGQSCLVWNPADSQVRGMIADEAGYIVKNYDVDGIHFDDYFYDPYYYGSTTAEQRRANVNALVKGVYSKVKAADSSARFGISPAGNVSDCLEGGADVATWLSNPGYIDYLVPQIYWSDSYGSGGSTHLFTDRLKAFMSINKNGTDIYAGLALYKVAAKPLTSVDPGWTNSSSNLADQMKTAYGMGVKGFSLFSSMYLDDASTQTELNNLVSAVKTYGFANLAASKLPTASSASFKNLNRATDGNISADNYADSSTGTGLQWVQLDLGSSCSISSVKLWHYFGDAREYHDVVIQLSDDPAFIKGVTTVFNNDTDGSAGLGAATDSEYAETSSGKFVTFSPVTARYARFWSNGSTLNKYNHYSEIEVYGTPGKPDVNLAASKLPAASSTAFRNLALATDGSVSAGSYADSFTSSGLQWVQLDLGSTCSISSVKLWHYFGDPRKYKDVVVQLSNDPAFKEEVTTVFNNDTDGSAGLGAGSDSEYAETSAGKYVAFYPVSARYARFYSSGSSVNKYSHYSEIQVFGAPGKPDANLAAAKLPEASSAAFKNLALATDGIVAVGNYADSYTGTGLQWVQVDLGASYSISSVRLWHYFGDSRKYHDVVVQLSDDPEFKTGVTTVFNNDADGSAGLGAATDSEYAETGSGKYIAFFPESARYVRLWSNGSTVNAYSHYAEIQINGK
jgi:uncharacterized lipoprotein YddW (UPF0748 family)